MNKAVLGDSSEDSAPDLSEAMDVRFRQQLKDLLATRRLAAHTGTPTTFQPTSGGISQNALGRAIQLLRSDVEADFSLAVPASNAGASRFRFCRAFRDGTGLSPYASLRQRRPEQVMEVAPPCRCVGRVDCRGAWLFLSDSFRAAALKPAKTSIRLALAAIALEAPQSLWSSADPDQLNRLNHDATCTEMKK